MKAKITPIITLFFLLGSLFSSNLYVFAQDTPDTKNQTLSIDDEEINVNGSLRLNFNLENKNEDETKYKIEIPDSFEYSTANNQIFSDNSINFDAKNKELQVDLKKEQYKNFSLEFIVKNVGKYTILAHDQITGESTNFSVNVSTDNKNSSEKKIVPTEKNINNDPAPRLVGDTPMINFPNTEAVQTNSSAIIDSKYAFVPTISPNTTSTLTVITGSSHSSVTTISNNATPYFWVSANNLNEVEYEVAFENVGYYNGNKINMTYHVKASNTSRSNINGMVTNVNYIGTGTNIGGPNIDLAQYNFFDENWAPIALSGNISMFNIQTNKELQIDKEQFDKFYISSDSQLGYTSPKTPIFTDTITNVMPQNSAAGTNNQTGFTALFSNQKSLSFSSLASSKESGGNATSAQLGIAVTPEYSLVTVALPPPNKDGFDINEVTDKDNLIYTGSQIIPTIDGTNTSKYFSSFIMEDQLDNVLIVNKDKIVIKNGKGTDVTNEFDISLDDSNKLTLSANDSALNTASFYGTTLYIYIYGHLDYSKNLTSYINGNRIVVPNTITTIANRLNSSTIEGGTSNIANATFPDFININGTKTWDDANNQDGKRPDSVTVNLLANGTKIDSKTVSAADDWKYSFTNLDKYKEGSEITYTVTEDSVPDYTTSINGADITNSYTPGKTNVSVTKTWNDSNNQDGLRPNKITVQLYANGKESGKPVELNSSNDWTTTWDNLDLKQNGNEVAYTVKEVGTVAGYTTTTNNSDKGNIIITNTHENEKTKINGTKTWDDANNQDGKRPDSVTVNLLANGTKIDSKTVSAADDWKYSFTNLDKYKEGSEITYTVTEDSVPDYTTSINGADITNSYTPGKTNVSVTKTWNDSNNQDGLRPNKITVQLYANGKESGKPVELNSSNDWTTTWDNLDLKQNGNEVAYTVKEVGTVAGYTTTTNNSDKGNIIITNTHNTKGRKTSYTPTNKNNNKFDGTLTKLLPKTGEKKNSLFSIIGILVLLTLFIFYIIQKYNRART